VNRPVREGIEWCILRWEQAPDLKLPRLLLIGDSIANGYHGPTSALLKGQVNVDLMASSASVTDPQWQASIRLAIADYKYTVIHFNNGLHGWHLKDEEYAGGLREMIKLLRELAPGAKLIWAASTPLTKPAEGHALDPVKNAVVLGRNEVAAQVMQEAGIPVHDLYSVLVGQAQLRANDPYHYNEAGRKLAAEAVVKTVREPLGLPAQ
jgi:lysophospholipase L1-like esterase